MDLCRQMNEEARHFNMIRTHLEELGGVWDDEYSPDLPEWNQLFALFIAYNLIQSGQPLYGWPLGAGAAAALVMVLSPPTTKALYAGD